MTLDEPTLRSLGYGVCVTYGDDSRDAHALTPWPDLLGGKVTRTDVELREAATARRRKQRAKRDQEEIRAMNRRHQQARRERLRAA